MLSMKNAIGWIGNVAVFRIGDEYVLLDVVSGKRKKIIKEA